MITGKRGKNSKRPTDETIITDHSVITNSAKNNQKLMNDSNIFNIANKIVKNKLKSETKSNPTLPLNKVKSIQRNKQSQKINFTPNKEKSESSVVQTGINSLPVLPSVGQGNCELSRKSIHYQF